MHTRTRSAGALGFVRGSTYVALLRLHGDTRGNGGQQRTLRSLWLLSGCTSAAAPAPSALQLPPELQNLLSRRLHISFKLAGTSSPSFLVVTAVIVAQTTGRPPWTDEQCERLGALT